MKKFWLVMLNDQNKLSEKRRNNTIATKEVYIWFFKRFFLRNKKTNISSKEERSKVVSNILSLSVY